MMRVYCQLGKAKVGFVTSIRTSTRVVTTKEPLVTPASHASVDIQPAQHLAQVSSRHKSSECRGTDLLRSWQLSGTQAARIH